MEVVYNVAKSWTCFIDYNYHNFRQVHLKKGIGYLDFLVAGNVNYFKNSMRNAIMYSKVITFIAR